METTTNSKIITMSFAIAGVIAGVTLSSLIRGLSGVFGAFARWTDGDIVRHGVPVIFGLGLFLFFQFHPKIWGWADEVIAEVRKVVWPSGKDTLAMSIAVCVMVLLSTLVITSFDFLSSFVIGLFMN
jgi:preprotein translocase subunit SecE